MPKKILFCATVATHLNAFHLPYMKWYKEQGWEVYAAANGGQQLPFVDKQYDISFARSPFKLKNFKAFKELRAVIDSVNFDIIHCHTPMGGILTRLASIGARKTGTKVVYTAHGFHFFNGAPILNWIIYYPIEKMMAYYTDCLITINSEDYKVATSRGFKAGNIVHVHGVGIDTKRFNVISPAAKQELRKQYNYDLDGILLFYAAEFNKNKNQQLLINALTKVRREFPAIRLLLAGNGALMDECKELAGNLGVSDIVVFLGYRDDIDKILPMCDIAVASSLREGLPVNIMEAMACGLPVIANDNRGHRELVKNNENGWLFKNEDEMVEVLLNILRKKSDKERYGHTGRNIVTNTYAMEKVMEEMTGIYKMITSTR